MHTTTCLSGDGGLGKSLLAMQIMTCCAASKSFIGRETMHAAAMGLFCEDRENQLHERQDAINQHYGLKYSDLTDLHYLPRVGDDNALVSLHYDKLQVTPFFYQFREHVIALECKLVIIDTAADTFLANENNRPQVRSYIQLLNGLANDIGGAVLLLSHPSAAGLMTGSGTSGSTAWNNSVRSRWYLERPKSENEAKEQDKNIRILTQKKSNYSALDSSGIELEWKDGTFAVKEGESSFLRQLEMNNLSKEIIDIIGVLSQKKVYLSLSEHSRNFAPKILKEKLKSKYSYKDVYHAVNKLFDEDKLINADIKIDRQPRTVLQVNPSVMGPSEAIDIPQN